MRVVLYTHDMIPITVLDVPSQYWEYLLHRGSIKVAIPPPMRLSPPKWEDAVPKLEIRQVTITVERFLRNGQTHVMLFTHDEESALLLESTFLPGQLRGLNEIRNEAFTRGFLKAISMM